MDSLTQIVLGAACGELVLGRKIGNRALLIGGIAGTIPDLDVISNFFTDEITALSMHRGFTHSVLFSFLFAPLFAWLTLQFYRRDVYRSSWWRWAVLILAASIFGRLGWAIGAASSTSMACIWSLTLGGLISGWLYRSYIKPNFSDLPQAATWREWSVLYWLALLTHPLLDACTTYGTQLLYPLSNKRFAWDNVSVFDPGFSIPFGLSILIAAFLTRQSSWRRMLTWLGVAYGCLYLYFGYITHERLTIMFDQALQAQGIDADRIKVSPSIGTNILWHGTAETDSIYYHELRSLFDHNELPFDFMTEPSNKELLAPHFGDRDVDILRWFSEDYYAVRQGNGDTLIYIDQRYGALPPELTGFDEPVYPFFYKLHPDSERGELVARGADEMQRMNMNAAIKNYIRRIRGYSK